MKRFGLAIFMFLLNLVFVKPVLAVNIVGWTERLDCQKIGGWTCDKDNPSKILSVHVYIDGQFNKSMSTDISRSDTDSVCGTGDNKRGFEIDIPLNFADGQNHSMEVYGVVENGTSYKLPLASNLSTNQINCVDPSRIIRVGINENMNGFAIAKTEAVNGAIIEECRVGSNIDDLYQILQWRNSQSLCGDNNNSSVSCPGANIAKETSVSRFCYWKDKKEIQVAVNNINQPYSGCLIHDTAEKRLNPGGYSIYLSRNISQTNNESWQSLGNLSKLKLVTGYRTDYYSTGSCPAGVSDPIFGTSKAAFAYTNVIVNQLDKVTGVPVATVFFQTVLYDNRSEWQNGTAEYKDCNQSGTAKIVVVGLPISRFGMAMALPGTGIKQYEWDILPRIKNEITACLGQVDFNDFVISNMFVGNELMGPVTMTNSFIDPHAELIVKPDYVFEKDECTIGDGNGDNKIDMTDLINWYQSYRSGNITNGDLNCDKKINTKDVVDWYMEYRK